MSSDTAECGVGEKLLWVENHWARDKDLNECDPSYMVDLITEIGKK